MPHHHHTHSKASSTSSVSIASPSVTSHHKAKSPHNSVKVLPATPTSTTFPSNIRLVRAGAPSIGILPPTNEGGAAFGTAPPASPGIMFAKRKRSPFKGPGIATQNPGGAGTNPWRSRSGGDVALAVLFYGGLAGGVLLTNREGGGASLQAYLFGSITSVTARDLYVVAGLAVVVLGIVLVVARDGWLALFIAVAIPGDIALLPILCIVVLPAWLLVSQAPEFRILPKPESDPSPAAPTG